ncbi:TIGR00282 family metallophosphoesterase, partial [bacterium]|nr:TIGR00282 family metallophosphoesterase [bacterium]
MGNPGRRAVSEMLQALRSRLNIDFVVLNGENSAGGFGITKQVAHDFFRAGVDAITLGNHTWSKRESWDYIDSETRVLRPANYPPGVPGRGWGVFKIENGIKIAVASLMGRTFMTPIDCPFRTADTILAGLDEDAHISIIDIHAEATSEKVALGYYVDGRASAVIGTHTHIQTSDERVLPSGTAYMTDAGMAGVTESVLGLDPVVAMERFLKQMPNRLKLAEGVPTLQGALIDIDESTGRATGIRRINLKSGEDNCELPQPV